ncbi:hypothetical protein EYZ11_001982 [Aspergillus tanneri]|uniref:Cysteine-rich transmembrane CYSTM domain-containing protein n=2 Tax=Aspergillus tanneri TaxID=1220188 RepID=A0A4S3JS23_9EURO|nr:hypothetical protein EYZ11_001982 [Aspergillus tanneri]
MSQQQYYAPQGQGYGPPPQGYPQQYGPPQGYYPPPGPPQGPPMSFAPQPPPTQKKSRGCLGAWDCDTVRGGDKR